VSSFAIFTATPDGLYNDWAGTGNVTFRYADGSLTWEWALGSNTTESLAHAINNFGIRVQQDLGNSGIEQIATAQATGLPEPGTLGLVLVGLAGLGFSRKRKQRQSAAV